MSSRSKDLSWTPVMFKTVVKIYVYRTHIPDSFYNAIDALKDDQLINTRTASNILKCLFENKETKDIFESPEKLIENLQLFSSIPDNGKLLGLGDSLNYQGHIVMLSSNEGEPFCSNMDAFIAFEREVNDDVCKFTAQMMKSIGNSMKRSSKDSFNLIGFKIFELKRHYERMVRERIEYETDLEFETIDDVYSILSTFYNKNHDGEILLNLRKMLDKQNIELPLIENQEFYQKIVTRHERYKASIESAYNNADPMKNDFLYPTYPVARLFIDKEKTNPVKRFFFAKELETALNIAMNNYHRKDFPQGLFRVETSEDRELGILKVVEYETFEKVLKILKLPTKCLHVVYYDIVITRRQTQVPVNTPYGTYGVLAKNALVDIVGQVTVGMKLFRTVNKQNILEVFGWFHRMDIFNPAHKHILFIETWKVDEIIDDAYNKLHKYCTESAYKLSKYSYTKSEVFNELSKFCPNFEQINSLKILTPTQESIFNAYCQKIFEKVLTKKKRYTRSDVHELYREAMFFTILTNIPKLGDFLSNQVGQMSQNMDAEARRLSEALEKSVHF